MKNEKDESTVVLTLRCNKCIPSLSTLQVAPKIVHKTALEISFGIFLKMLFYQTSARFFNAETGRSCNHSL